MPRQGAKILKDKIMIPKTVRGFLLQLKELGEDTLVGDLKCTNQLTDEQANYLRGIIAGIQNELGDMDLNIWEKFNVKPYKTHYIDYDYK